MSDRVRGARGGLCVGCDGAAERQIQVLQGLWLYVCPNCDRVNSPLADRLRELRR